MNVMSKKQLRDRLLAMPPSRGTGYTTEYFTVGDAERWCGYSRGGLRRFVKTGEGLSNDAQRQLGNFSSLLGGDCVNNPR